MMNSSTTQLVTEPSICIPRTLNNVSWREVKDTFERIFGKGTVERVDIVRRRDDDSPFCRIFIHMRYWPMADDRVVKIRQKLLDGEEVKVVYNQPWFWKCAASRLPKPEKRNVSTTPYVEADGLDSKPAVDVVAE